MSPAGYLRSLVLSLFARALFRRVHERACTCCDVFDAADAAGLGDHFVGVQELLKTPQFLAVVAQRVLDIVELGALAVRLDRRWVSAQRRGRRFAALDRGRSLLRRSEAERIHRRLCAQAQIRQEVDRHLLQDRNRVRLGIRHVAVGVHE